MRSNWKLVTVMAAASMVAGALSKGVPELASQVAPPFPSWEIIRASANPQYADQRDHIPAGFGRLVAVDSQWKSSGAGQSWLWFEAPNGTIRVVVVETSGKQSTYVWKIVKEFPRR